MQVYCLTSWDELAPYADAWEGLSGGIPFRGWTWLSHWWRHYGPRNVAEAARRQLATLCAFDDGDRLVGVAPWYLDCSAMRGRVLRPLGSGEVCSDYLSILCAPSREDAVVEAMADYLIHNIGAAADALRWTLLALDGVDAADRRMAALVGHLAGQGCTVDRRPRVNCWRLNLPTDWNAYVASLSRNLRRDVRRLERTLLDTGRATLRSVRRHDELPRAMDILIDLHQRRRRALGERGCFASHRFLAFFRDVLPDLLRNGQLLFSWIEIDGRPVAAEYQLVGNGVLYEYQAGMDPAAAEHQPGKLIITAILRRAIAEGYREFDFLRGDEPYKARFGAVARPTVEYRATPLRPVAQLRRGFWLAGKNVKQWGREVGKGLGILC